LKGKQDPKRRPRVPFAAAIVVALVLAVGGWLILRRPHPAAPQADDETVEEVSPPPERPPLPPRTVEQPAVAVRKPAPLEYMSDGVPIMPAGPDDPHPDTFVHPHPITPRHKRIFRENALLYQLNEAMDGKEAPRLRALLKQYRDEYPEDPQDMQKGYTLIADCLEHPSEDTRAAAQRFYDEEIASTLRRFVMRHCLQDNR
jgi:hypothetical protein